jgi:hypothetical protein
LQYLYFNESCAAAKKNKVDQLPVKSKNWKLGIDTLITCSWRRKNTIIRKERIKDLAQLIRVPFDRDGEGRRFWCCYCAFTNQF